LLKKKDLFWKRNHLQLTKQQTQHKSRKNPKRKKNPKLRKSPNPLKQPLFQNRIWRPLVKKPRKKWFPKKKPSGLQQMHNL